MTHLFDTNARLKLKQQLTLNNPLEWNGKQPNEMIVKRVDAKFCRENNSPKKLGGLKDE